jgi:hypothetical protein
MKQRFTDYEELPVWLIDYILTVADAGRITDISLDDINDFLQGLDEFHERSQDTYSDLGHDRVRINN